MINALRISLLTWAAIVAACFLLLLLASGLVTDVRAATYTGSATSYSSCSSGGITATGSPTFFGEVASNTIPLGSTIELVHPRSIGGRRYFRVLDTGGPGFLIDVFAPSCSWAIQFGRRQVTVRTVRIGISARARRVRERHQPDWGRVRASHVR